LDVHCLAPEKGMGIGNQRIPWRVFADFIWIYWWELVPVFELVDLRDFCADDDHLNIVICD